MTFLQCNLQLACWISVIALILSNRIVDASVFSWENGLRKCDDSNTRQPTLEDVSIIRQDSWLYAARIFLPEGNAEGASIVIIKVINNTDKDIRSCTNCSVSCPCIVFNKSRSSLILQQRRMEPGIHYILHDYAFEDFPDPDECLKYHVQDEAPTFVNCGDQHGIQCIDDSQTDSAPTVAACYQEYKNDSRCVSLPKIHEKDLTQDGSATHCTIPWLCQTRHTCGIFLIVGSIVIFGIFNVLCIYCSVNYFVRRKLTNMTSVPGDPVPNVVKSTVHIYSHM